MENHRGWTPDKSPIELKDNSIIVFVHKSKAIKNTRRHNKISLYKNVNIKVYIDWFTRRLHQGEVLQG